MARPRKDGMDYFPHDVNLSTDKKIEALRILHGNDGYVFFCIMLENIYQEPNFELEVSDAETIQILAKKVEVTPMKLEEMIKTAIKHGCFDRNRYEKDGVLTSNGIKKRAEVVTKKRANMRKDYESKVSGTVSDAETIPESAQSKSKSKSINNKDMSDSPSVSDLAFEEWYATYPKGRSVRKQALSSWNSLWKKNKIDIQEITEGTAAYLHYQQTKGYEVCGAQVFLNQERWKDSWIVTDGAPKGPKQQAARQEGPFAPNPIPMTAERWDYYQRLRYGEEE